MKVLSLVSFLHRYLPLYHLYGRQFLLLQNKSLGAMKTVNVSSFCKGSDLIKSKSNKRLTKQVLTVFLSFHALCLPYTLLFCLSGSSLILKVIGVLDATMMLTVTLSICASPHRLCFDLWLLGLCKCKKIPRCWSRYFFNLDTKELSQEEGYAHGEVRYRNLRIIAVLVGAFLI